MPFLVPFLEHLNSPRMQAVISALTGEAGREAFEAYEATKDESKIRDLFDRLIGHAAEPTPDQERPQQEA